MKNTVSLTINKCDEETFKELGNKLKKIRMHRGVSQQLLSEKTNRDRSGLSGYERGVKTPTLHGLYDISNALNYNLKIQFEERDGLNSMFRDKVFTEDFVQSFIDNMSKEDTYEYSLADSMQVLDEEWNVVELDGDKVVLKSNKDTIVELNKLNLDVELSSKKYQPIEINYIKKEEGRNHSFKTFVDLTGVYSLDTAYDVRSTIITCISLDGILDTIGYLEDSDNFINSNFVESLQLYSYMKLKTEYRLKDTDIIDIIKILDIDVKGATFLDILNSNNAQAADNDIWLRVGAKFSIDNYIEKGYLDEHILVRLIRLAHFLRLDHYVCRFLYDGLDESLESAITPESAGNITCTILIFKEITSLIKECFNYLKSMEGRNKDKNEYTIMMDMVYVFYSNVNISFISDVISDVINDVLNESTDYDYNY